MTISVCLVYVSNQLRVFLIYFSGEKRRLVVPPSLGYGAEGVPKGKIMLVEWIKDNACDAKDKCHLETIHVVVRGISCNNVSF